MEQELAVYALFGAITVPDGNSLLTKFDPAWESVHREFFARGSLSLFAGHKNAAPDQSGAA
jgi:hypothetical protein